MASIQMSGESKPHQIGEPKKAWSSETNTGDESRSGKKKHKASPKKQPERNPGYNQKVDQRRPKQTVPVNYHNHNRYHTRPPLPLDFLQSVPETSQSKQNLRQAEARLNDLLDDLSEKMKDFRKNPKDDFFGNIEFVQNLLCGSMDKLERLMQSDIRPMTAPPGNYADGQQLPSQLQEKLNPLTDLYKSSQQTIKELQNENNRLQKHVPYDTLTRPETSPIRRPQKSPQNEIERLQSEIDRYERDKVSLQNTIQGQSEKLKLAITTMKQLEREKDEALLRLSEIAGRRLRENNPAVADLSNENRPTKLAEKYKELYDNEWTNAFFEMVELKISNQEAIANLLQILLDAYGFCMVYSDRQFKKLTAFETYYGHEDHKQQVQSFELSSETLDLAKHLRKSASPAIVSTIQNAFMETLTSKKSIKIYPETEKYCHKCVELMWFMSVQIPPMALGSIPNRGAKVDLENYAYYTMDGPFVDFVVWPACLIEKNGSILAKGVLQAQKSEKGIGHED